MPQIIWKGCVPKGINVTMTIHVQNMVPVPDVATGQT